MVHVLEEVSRPSWMQKSSSSLPFSSTRRRTGEARFPEPVREVPPNTPFGSQIQSGLPESSRVAPADRNGGDSAAGTSWMERSTVPEQVENRRKGTITPRGTERA